MEREREGGRERDIERERERDRERGFGVYLARPVERRAEDALHQVMIDAPTSSERSQPPQPLNPQPQTSSSPTSKTLNPG